MERNPEEGAKSRTKVAPKHEPPHPETSTSNVGVNTDVAMDPAIWGNLQEFINLEMVYAKLPLHEFYQLRSVCSAWNLLAGNWRFLTRFSGPPFPKPCFILFGSVGFWCHHVMLVYDAKRGDWVRRPLPHFAFKKGKTVAAEGFVYSATCQNPQQGSVFNIHTKAYRKLPTLYEHDSSKDTAITVSEIAADPRSGSYKLLVAMGYPKMQTYVYDSASESWTLKSAELSRVKFECGISVHCNGVLYIKCRRRSRPALVGYDFERDSWAFLPPAPHQRGVDGHYSGLGAWNGALYDVAGNDEGLPCVWELQRCGQEWSEVGRMPADMHSWLKPQGGCPHRDYLLKTLYCEEHILMCPMEWTPQCLTRFVLYNLSLKAWDRFEVPKDSKDGLGDEDMEKLSDFAMENSNGSVSADDVQKLIDFAENHPNEKMPWA